ncbi:PTS sugar transporter subunit IIA [Gracilibacillus timonensis]|uniref:PTS sugar transporter subunit IIA n=1 Tax=Gracilibacillus timonensis TaxID=1816696 RepID=UPI000825EDAB|nr:fructose PTS transporter subunit IIA [Gracilibacillus timonensis]
MIKKELIFLGVQAIEKNEVFGFLSEKVQKEGLIEDISAFTNAVIERENQVSTNVDFQIAIPHGKSQTVLEPFISFMSTQQPIQWDEGENGTVKYIFLIGVPKHGGDKTHLKYISEVSKKLIDEEFRDMLFQCQTQEQAYQLLNKINVEINEK